MTSYVMNVIVKNIATEVVVNRLISSGETFVDKYHPQYVITEADPLPTKTTTVATRPLTGQQVTTTNDLTSLKANTQVNSVITELSQQPHQQQYTEVVSAVITESQNKTYTTMVVEETTTSTKQIVVAVQDKATKQVTIIGQTPVTQQQV